MAHELLSPRWWVDRLQMRLDIERASMDLFERYYRGDHPLPYVVRELEDAYRMLLSRSRVNFMRLVVDAAEERLNIQGFRFGDVQADRDAWTIWQRNGMDAEAQLGHREALVKKRANVIVWPDADGEPQITVEDGTSTIVEHHPGNRRKRAAALKSWEDDWTGDQMSTLYLPDGIYKFRRSGSQEWENRELNSEPWPLPNPLGVVPVVPLVNRPDLHGDGESELSDVTDSQDRVNKILFDRMMASEFTSFRQRWATGVDIPSDPETGEPVEPFQIAVQRLLVNENPEGKFGQFDQTDLGPYLDAAEQDLKFIAAATRTPPHYLNTSADRLSGESIKAAETGLVAKVKRKQVHFGEAWEEIMRLAFAVSDDPRSEYRQAETLWRDPESRTESEHIDAVVKQRQGLQIPLRAAWLAAGHSPTDVDRMWSELRAESLSMQAVDLSQLLSADGA